MKDDIQPLTPGQLEIARKLEESCEATTLYPQRYVDALNKEIRTLTDAMRYLICAAQYVLRHDWIPNAPVGTRLLALDDLHTAVERANEILKAQSAKGQR